MHYSIKDTVNLHLNRHKGNVSVTSFHIISFTLHSTCKYDKAKLLLTVQYFPTYFVFGAAH